jgi:hypothetical protein
MIPTKSTIQIITPFGSGYVPLEHSDRAHWNLGFADVDDVIEALRSSMFSKVLKSLRSALSLR